MPLLSKLYEESDTDFEGNRNEPVVETIADRIFLQAHANELATVKKILLALAHGVITVDRSGRVTWCNDSTLRLLNLERKQLLGALLAAATSQPEFGSFVETVFTHGSGEQEIYLAKPAERLLRVQGQSLMGEPGALEALLEIQDVTRLHQLEVMRRDFVANVSHELRTPVTAIQGFVETLLDGHVENPTDVRRFLSIIGRQVKRLTSLIDDLLKLSSLEADDRTREIRMQRECLNHVAESALEVCSVKASEKGIRIELVSTHPVYSNANALLVEQAIINLVDNAIKFSPRGATVSVVVESRHGQAAKISVRDRGPGVGEHHVPRLFERFYRADPARSRKDGGTGLGLAIVKHIAQVHGGSVEVESELGIGSTFSFILPDRSE